MSASQAEDAGSIHAIRLYKNEELFVPPFCYAKITIKIPFKIAR